jgi:CheY-like chemotaxis protein
MMLLLWEVDSLVFADGHEAWAWLDEVERGSHPLPLPEVALLDIRMPGHLGYEIGARMRAIRATSAIPLLIMTAYHLSDQDRAQIYESARPEHLVPKPFPALDEFRSLIEATIAVSRPGSSNFPTDHERADRGLLSLTAHQWRSPGINQNGFRLKPDKWGDG